MPVDRERIDNLFRKLGRELTKISAKPQPKNVHQFRTATRRVEALAELLPDHDRNFRKLLKQLGHLRRRAGKVRDLDVLNANLRSLKVSEEPGRKAQVLRALADQRVRREQKLTEALDADTVRKIKKRLNRAAGSIVLSQAADPVACSIQSFARLAEENPVLNEDVLHRYRIEGKRIRYTAELGGDDPQAQRVVAALKRMQDAIGDWHDWLTLREKTQELATDGRPSAMIAALTNITRAKYRDALQVVAEVKAELLQTTPSSPKIVANAAPRRKPAASEQVATAAIA
jgi:CHAD domain-containing protein